MRTRSDEFRMNRSRNLALGPPYYHTVARRSSSTVSGGLQVAVCPTLEDYLEPFDQKRVFSVRPLLTPENYYEHVLGLIDGAKEVLRLSQRSTWLTLTTYLTTYP
jgi:hypothetical protein